MLTKNDVDFPCRIVVLCVDCLVCDNLPDGEYRPLGCIVLVGVLVPFSNPLSINLFVQGLETPERALGR